MSSLSIKPSGAQALRYSKSFYFFYYGAAASLIPFLAVYFESLGLDGRQIGVLVGISPLVSMFSAPFWGGVADTTAQYKRILRLPIFGALVTVLCLSFASQFFWLFAIVAVFAFFTAPIIPLIDNSVMNLLGERKSEYGKQRLWGAIGWGVSAPIIGFLSEQAGMRWIFWGYLVLLTLAGLTSFKLTIIPTHIGQRFGSGFRQLLHNWQWVLFLSVVFVGGMTMSLLGNFLFLYIADLGGSNLLMGMALTFATISEVPFLFFSNRFLQRWGSNGLMVISLITYVVRLLATAWAPVPWLILPIQLLHGLSFSAMWVAGVSYADELAPPGMGATAQGIFAATMLGLGSACGAFLGGVLYENLGGALMYQWAALGVLLTLGLFVLANRKIARTNQGLI